MEAWRSGTPQDKSGIVSAITQALYNVTKEEAQALPNKDFATASMYEGMLGWVDRQKQSIWWLFGRKGFTAQKMGSDSLGTSGRGLSHSTSRRQAV